MSLIQEPFAMKPTFASGSDAVREPHIVSGAEGQTGTVRFGIPVCCEEVGTFSSNGGYRAGRATRQATLVSIFTPPLPFTLTIYFKQVAPTLKHRLNPWIARETALFA